MFRVFIPSPISILLLVILVPLVIEISSLPAPAPRLVFISLLLPSNVIVLLPSPKFTPVRPSISSILEMVEFVT